jgi:hypothetical protein
MLNGAQDVNTTHTPRGFLRQPQMEGFFVLVDPRSCALEFPGQVQGQGLADFLRLR